MPLYAPTLFPPAILLVAALLRTALAEDLAGLGQPCYGPDEISCADRPAVVCRKKDGSRPLYMSGEFGICRKLRGINQSCSSVQELCGSVPIIGLHLDKPNRPMNFHLVCEEGVCVVRTEGKFQNSCHPKVLALGGKPCRDVPDCNTGEGPLYCEIVSAFPSTLYACVSKDIPVGGPCPNGVASPVNYKVYRLCVAGAKCLGGDRLTPGTCTAD